MTPAAVPVTLWLSCHVDYACRHSGACCRAGWPLPVETGAVPAIGAAVASGRLVTVDRAVVWLRETADAPDDIAGTFRLAEGGCVFHVSTPAPGRGHQHERHCAVHATLGHAALPASCQHFPRVCLVDARGVRVSLSHFCPTAAAMLVDDPRPVSIVHGPRPVPGVAVPEGLDARDQLPPRLNDRVLMDLDALSAWEAHVVGALAGPDAWPGRAEDVVTRLAHQAAHLARWTPGAESLVDAVGGLHADTPSGGDGAAAEWSADSAFALVGDACRAPWTWPAPPVHLAALDLSCVAPVWAEVAPVVRRYLAGKAFGAWMTYHADAARGLVAWLGVALTVLRTECARACQGDRRRLDRDRLLTAVRQADLLLVHYADSAALAVAIARGRPRR